MDCGRFVGSGVASNRQGKQDKIEDTMHGVCDRYTPSPLIKFPRNALSINKEEDIALLDVLKPNNISDETPEDNNISNYDEKSTPRLHTNHEQKNDAHQSVEIKEEETNPDNQPNENISLFAYCQVNN